MPAPAHPDGSRHDRHLEFIRRAGETTRRAIAEHTGLSRSVVAQTVAELIAQGLVEEHRVEVRRAAAGSAAMAGTAMASSALAAGSAPVRRAHSAPADASRTGRRGRPTAVLRLAHQQGAIVACDIGHAHITVAVTDLQARVRRERRIPFPVDTGAAATFAALHTLVAECLASCGVTAAGVQAFGVSFPYPVIRTRGTVRAPLHLTGWQGALAADAVPPAFNCPLVFDNDANFGLWGERMHGAGRGIDNLLYIKLADGIGAGLLVDGLVLAGARGIGGEMGHLRVDPLGAPCRCGNRGCLESVSYTHL
ncbi:ROK family transcriptional regulator, partial [Subtercola sp. RTI3]|uniref:ROK family transcriptional regulator n=1 Tax=Subtercola sp. RTI3 TaxID=3048639 RepID=UPI002B231BF7